METMLPAFTLKNSPGTWLTGLLTLQMSREGHLLAGPGSLGHLGNIERREVYSNLSVLQEKSGGPVLGLASRPWEAFKCLKVLRKIPAKQAQKSLCDQLHSCCSYVSNHAKYSKTGLTL